MVRRATRRPSGCAIDMAVIGRANALRPNRRTAPSDGYFCQEHASEYNRGWDYFQGLDKEERDRRAHHEQRDAGAYTQSAHHSWAGPGDGTRTRDEMRALDILGLESDADFDEVKKSWARARQDVSPGCSARRC